MDKLIAIARVGRPHGLRGFVFVHPFNENCDLIEGGAELLLLGNDGEVREVGVAECRPTPRGPLVRLQGAEDRNAAEAMVGLTLAVPESRLPAPGRDEFYYHEVVGFDVVDRSGARLGRVTSVFATSTDVLAVTGEGGEVLVPCTDQHVLSLDRVRRLIVIDREACEPW